MATAFTVLLDHHRLEVNARGKWTAGTGRGSILFVYCSSLSSPVLVTSTPLGPPLRVSIHPAGQGEEGEVVGTNRRDC